MTKPKQAKKLYWYARTKDISWMGPFTTQERAWEATIGLDGSGCPLPTAQVFCLTTDLSKKKDSK